MSNIEKIKKTINVYKTTDGKEFYEESKAQKHQNYLDTEKVYIITKTIIARKQKEKSIFGCYKTYDLAIKNYEKLEEEKFKICGGGNKIEYFVEELCVIEK